MPSIDDVADSTDWLSTPLAALTPLESSLRCQVCKDFFTTPMITSCSHTFCSLCIRRYLSQEGRCPACREPEQELKLRRNWAVEEMVAHFTASRDGLLTFARGAAAEAEARSADIERPSKKRKIEGNTNGTERRSTRSQSRRIASQSSQLDGMSSQEVITDSETGSVYDESSPPKPAKSEPQASDPDSKIVNCPCCFKRVKSMYINLHLDSCVDGDSSKHLDTPSPPASVPQPQFSLGALTNNQPKPLKQMERLPFINYSLLNDNALRKKLRELGIPNYGPKELMRKRHTEWVNLWNSNCDSRNPVSKAKLLQDLDIWERTLGRQNDKGPSGFMVKDFDRDSHVKSHKSDFDDLIKQARQKKAAAAKAQESSKAEAVPEPGMVENPIQMDDVFSSRPQPANMDVGNPSLDVQVHSTPPESGSTDNVAELSLSRRPTGDPSLSQKSMSNDIIV